MASYQTGNRSGCHIHGRGSLMIYSTFIGLDVHARSVSAAALDPLQGTIESKRFSYSPAEIASWINSFDSPICIYESGVTGFHLARELVSFGVECKIAASSKLHRPIADAKKKNDINDAIFLARALSMGNIEEVFVPDEETEAARDLVRALDDVRSDLLRKRHQLSKFLMRHGHTFNDKNPSGTPVGSWTKRHWEWIRGIDFSHEPDQLTFDLYISEVRHAENHKKMLEREVAKLAQKPRWIARVNALRCLKGIETITAFALCAEIGVFSRFDTAKAFAAYVGLVPSEHSSGQKHATGEITKCGNTQVRRLLIESAWHYARASETRKKRPDASVPLSIENHAARATKRLVRQRKHLLQRGKRSIVANVATARELACFVWAIGRMAEGTM